MPPFISTFLQAWAGRRRARRRRANLRAGERGDSAKPGRPALKLIRLDAGTAPIRPGAGRAVWIVAAAVCIAAAGGAVIAGHARHLAATTASTPQAANNIRAANAYQSAMPGVAFTVPSQPGISTSLYPGGVLLVAAGMQASPTVRVDLCSQLRSPAGNLSLIHI